MDFPSLRSAIDALERKGWLRRVTEDVDPHLEMAEVHRRVYDAGGPALYFERVKGSPFPAVSNLFGTRERTLFLLGDGVRRAQALVALKADPSRVLRHPLRSAGALWRARTGLPLPELPLCPVPVAARTTTLSRLPAIHSWPRDGGGFVTWPLVYTEHPDKPGVFGSNLGMYRVQLTGNEYLPDREAGLHYQIHRGIGVHHHAALQRGETLKVSVFVGGPPAHILAGIMPLPEGLPEVLFGGVLAGRHFRFARRGGHLLSADADFCITGTVEPGRLKPEGPFGDHIGYYSLTHDFPVLTIDKVYHRQDAVWPFTVVGRPPQEDAQIASLIHEIADGALSQEIKGLRAVHAVEAAGVHPLLLGIANDRYAPYLERKPRELHTIAHGMLGYGQMSLAKYLFVAAHEDDPGLNIRDVDAYFAHVLRRVDWRTSLHFVTNTTMDTLDYTGGAINEGSKVFVAVSGAPRRELAEDLPAALRAAWPDHWGAPRLVRPGIVAFRGAAYGTDGPAPGVSTAGGAAAVDATALDAQLAGFTERLRAAGLMDTPALDGLPLWVLCDDPDFVAADFDNWLWVTFTRSDPARDIHGVGAFTVDKHWGARGPIVIDARIKPWHAPVLEPDPEVARRVEALAAPGKSLHGLF